MYTYWINKWFSPFDVVLCSMSEAGLVCLCRPVFHSGAQCRVRGLGDKQGPGRGERVRGLGARGASTNEPHSFPHVGIWWPIVLSHRGRSDAICWHVLSCHKLPIPLRPRQDSRRKARAACFTEFHSFTCVLWKQQWLRHARARIRMNAHMRTHNHTDMDISVILTQHLL